MEMYKQLSVTPQDDDPLIVDFFVWLDGCYVSPVTNLVVNKTTDTRIKHTRKEIKDKARESLFLANRETTKEFFKNVIIYGTTNLPAANR